MILNRREVFPQLPLGMHAAQDRGSDDFVARPAALRIIHRRRAVEKRP